MVKVSVVGAGLIGLAIAWRAAQQGFDVTVFDPAPGSGACRAAAGMLAPLSELTFGEEPAHEVALASLALFDSFVADVRRASGSPVQVRRTGTMLVGLTADDLAHVHDVTALHAAVGGDSRRVLPSQVRAIEPAISPRIRGGVYVPDDVQVDPMGLHEALLTVLGDRVRHCAVRSVATGVVHLADDSSWTTDVVIVAAGARSAELVPDLPVRPVVGSTMLLSPRPGCSVPLQHTVRALVHGRATYIVPTLTGNVVVGASSADRGFAESATVTELLDLLRPAVDVVPELGDMNFEGVRTGWRPTTPDHMPIVGYVADGVMVATGHWRHGVLLTPWTADAAVSALRQPQADPDPLCGPTRFTSARSR